MEDASLKVSTAGRSIDASSFTVACCCGITDVTLQVEWVCLENGDSVGTFEANSLF
ncbi:hypothetical protein P692DRAFT_20835164, partial [Suillus brevipes Sb2]